MLYPNVERALGLREGEGTRYLRNYEDRQTEAWAEFKTRLNAAIATKEALDNAVTGAKQLFASLAEILTAIGKPEDSRRVHATSVNPEAGSHKVPQNEVELQVVREAAGVCLREFPYIRERYGERGERYTKSDGAWLATLPDLPAQIVEKQVAWLGRFLSALGMPRITLQRHLEVTEILLSERLPQNADRYRVLRVVATGLERRQSEVIEPEAALRSRDAFVAAIGYERTSFEYVGDLLVSAVADEHLDGSGALEATMRWIRERSGWPTPVVGACEQLVFTLERQEAR